jgi:vitamin B12 transporter
MTLKTPSFLSVLSLMFSCSVFAQDELGETLDVQASEVLPALTVKAQKTANARPVTTYESPISNLDFDPRVDMQSRNMAEAQGDLSIRGGIFENTGIQVGAASLLDPQTGHYTTELPIAPEMLSEPVIHTGADNALRGFNSSVGTVGYSWSKMTQGGSVTLGGGDHDLNFQRLHNAWKGPYGESGEWIWGAEIETSHSESDGTIPFGDHDFDRTTGRLQLLGPNSQTDLFAGYQDKFFGLYGMYTGDLYTSFNPYETESVRTQLFLANHKQSYGEGSNWEATVYFRRNNDHYQFNRLSPDNRFVHETDVTSFALAGLHEIEDGFGVNYGMQIASDKIESSSLEEGKFTSRNYYKLTLLPQFHRELSDRKNLVFRVGASFDDTNRDGSQVSPVASLTLLSDDSLGNSERTYLSYAETTQVVGYGAEGGNETRGLFRSNHDLAREVTRNLELGHALERPEWSLEGSVFYRWTDDLVDWTYTGTGARSAENVDIETYGLELIVSRQLEKLEGIASYSYLHKNEDYGNSLVDGSFYALNFPEHRITLSFIYDPNDLLQIRVDNEWREQRANSLRKGPDNSMYTHLAASYYPARIDDLEVFVAFDKPWDEDFQDIPGTPGRGDQFSMGATLRW